MANCLLTVCKLFANCSPILIKTHFLRVHVYAMQYNYAKFHTSSIVSIKIVICWIFNRNLKNTFIRKDCNKNLHSMWKYPPTMSLNILKDIFLPNRWPSWTYTISKKGIPWIYWNNPFSIICSYLKPFSTSLNN